MRGSVARGVALVRDPSPRLTDGIVTHIPRTAVDVDAARRQHSAYVAALSAHGWRPVAVPDSAPYPDGVFVEDTAVVVGDVAVLTRPGVHARSMEIVGTGEALTGLGIQVVPIHAPGTLEGGDVLQVGRTVYVGRSGRTNGEGIRQLRSVMTPLGRTVVPVILRDVLHLKSAVTALPDGTLLGLPHLLNIDGLPSIRRPPEEEGAHVVPVGEGAVLIAASAPRTADWLDGLGFDVVPVDVGEFEKLEGCVTCLSVLLPGVGA